MDSNSKWHNVARIVHVGGGLRAVNNPGNEVILGPILGSAESTKFEIPSYPSLIRTVSDLGMTVVGADFYETSEQLDGLVPPEWRPTDLSSRKDAGFEAIDLWNQIAHAGYVEEDMRFVDCASRVAFEARASSWRLRDLSERYCKQINWCVAQKYRDTIQFENTGSFEVYLATHAFFMESCVLRDALAEFCSRFVFNRVFDENHNISTMSSLRKALRKNHELIADDTLATEILKITDFDKSDPWLAELGAYRDIVLHSAPLHEATSKAFLIHRVFRAKNGIDYPTLVNPIPDIPGEVLRRRSTGPIFESRQDWIDAFSSIDIQSEKLIDSLECASRYFNQLAHLAVRIGYRSPISAKRPTFEYDQNTGLLIPLGNLADDDTVPRQ